MADPLSITASLLAVITAAVQSTKSLFDTVKRLKNRDKTLRRLQEELKDLIDILGLLDQAANTKQSALTLCGALSNDAAKTHTSKISRQVLQEHNEMVKDTQYNLELRLCRIDEKLIRLTRDPDKASSSGIDLEDEREVTRQCLRICEDARAYIESLSRRDAVLLEEKPRTIAKEDPFEAQLRTRQALLDNQGAFAQTIGHLQRRLDLLVQNDGPTKDEERSHLRADVEVSKQCLDVCKLASEASHQKVYRIGEVIAEGDSDQVVVTTLADLFDIRKALSKDNSAQLVGSRTAENLQHLTEKRYSSRFGTSTKTWTVSSPAVSNIKSDHILAAHTRHDDQPTESRTRQNKPFPNETRRRFMDDSAAQERDSMTEDG